jgi:ubiquinone/menaquinone biosynthesis C-methylase UbiE
MEDTKVNGFEFDLINEFFSELERQGPGCAEETIRALGFLGNLSSKTKIADLGCGTGTQTMVLAQHTQAAITALDLYAGSIEKLNQTMEKHGLQNRVTGIVGSMDDLPFEKEEFDVLWSEGCDCQYQV